MGYNGKWIDSFSVSVYDGKEIPRAKGKIVLETPYIDYLFDKEQWVEFKKKVNEV
ncbi:hypothetical protein [Methanobrevibacter sp.]|uniref:hypothetical protein n=1 Tax=Methanobrevibacter sp. TaxID=66852 RepID=UPI00386C7B70